MADATGLGVLDFEFLLVGDRREAGQLVEVRDDSGQHPKYAGTVERDFLVRVLKVVDNGPEDRLTPAF